ncbi:DUF3970 family protein [Anaerobacillus alkalidiazotrophicus]|uniref:DUF3970 family protein n=1 Tax=Anaerobacillus alkalidiazotrophicus TaxID=472963 RepID=UPI000A029909|nr:DUF3970 family protein [Anaerobacillus alkalidiazotrophicus]
MVKVRLQGLAEEIKLMIDNFRNHYDVLQVSLPYQNRGSQYVRVYVEMRLKK